MEIVLCVGGQCSSSVHCAIIRKNCFVFSSSITLYLAVAGVNAVVSFVALTLLVSVFVVTGVTCARTHVVVDERGGVTTVEVCF